MVHDLVRDPEENPFHVSGKRVVVKNPSAVIENIGRSLNAAQLIKLVDVTKCCICAASI